LPDDYVIITSSWVDLSYQWNLWITVQKLLKTTSEIKDTTDNKYYTYTLNVNKKNFELLWFTEWDKTLWYNWINKVYADYTNRYVYTLGDKLWILLDIWTNLPIQEKKSLIFTWVDIVNVTDEYKAIIDNNTSFIWTWIELKSLTSGIQTNSLTYVNSCNDIFLHWFSKWDWLYWINPTWTWSFQVYCDMITDWWGWTLVARALAWIDMESFSWNISLIKPDQNLASRLPVSSIISISRKLNYETRFSVDKFSTKYYFQWNNWFAWDYMNIRLWSWSTFNQTLKTLYTSSYSNNITTWINWCLGWYSPFTWNNSCQTIWTYSFCAWIWHSWFWTSAWCTNTWVDWHIEDNQHRSWTLWVR
jgi:hypothetical protein